MFLYVSIWFKTCFIRQFDVWMERILSLKHLEAVVLLECNVLMVFFEIV